MLHVVLLFVGGTVGLVHFEVLTFAIVSRVLTASATSEDEFVLIVSDGLISAAVLQVDHQDHYICVFVEHGTRSLCKAHLESDDAKFVEL